MRSCAKRSILSFDGFFSNGDRALFQPLVNSLLTRDDYMLLADYQDYVECQERVSDVYSRSVQHGRGCPF